MKIGVILPDQPPEIGGGYSFVLTVLEALFQAESHSQHDFYYFATEEYGPVFKPTDGRRVVIVPKAPRREIRMLQKAAAKTRAFYRKLMHGEIEYTTPTWLTHKVAELKIDLVWFTAPFYNHVRVPFVFTHWDLQHLVQPWFPEVSLNGVWESRQSLYSRYVPRSVRVIAPNEVGRRELVENLSISPDRVMVLPHPTPGFALKDECDPKALERFEGFGIRGRYILYPAQFWPHKNHIGAMRAVKALREKTGEKIALVFSGSDAGNMPYVRKKAAELRMSDHVYFLGFVDVEVLRVLYQKASCLLYASYFGPENLPPLEAFGFGCPVVAADVDGAQEQLGDAAVLVNPSDPDEIAAALQRVLYDEAYAQELIAKGHVRAKSWTSRDYVDKLMLFFDEFVPVRECWE